MANPIDAPFCAISDICWAWGGSLHYTRKRTCAVQIQMFAEGQERIFTSPIFVRFCGECKGAVTSTTSVAALGQQGRARANQKNNFRSSARFSEQRAFLNGRSWNGQSDSELV
ncbi:MAG TPA: hypothetical protein VH985_01415, partial [Candidatus Binatia bacterium]